MSDGMPIGCSFEMSGILPQRGKILAPAGAAVKQERAAIVGKGIIEERKPGALRQNH